MVRFAQNLGWGGTNQVPGTVPSGKTPKSEPYHAVEKRHYIHTKVQMGEVNGSFLTNQTGW